MLKLDPRILSGLREIERQVHSASKEVDPKSDRFQDALICIQDALNEVKQIAGYGCPFSPGDAVVFEPENFNPDYWNKLSERDRIKYYGSLGYGDGSEKKKVFVFMGEITQAPGHCILVSLDDQKVETMRHTSDFRLVTEEEL